uniref:Ubiquitin-activating enzyme E1-like n=1 Tax=Bionectria ochroleuca TaxID=29856 RepID=A0A0B7K5X6_BIOOC
MEEPPSSAAQTAPATENGPSDPSKQQQPEQQENHETPQKPNPNATPGSRSQIPRRDRFNHQSLGPSLNSTVKQARVLMVGAGGIGCELLKNLVLSGFGEIHIVDLDTIDLSNLNRQFLFRQEHIKKSKALVAKDAAQKFNPNVQIVAHHANIKDAQFTVSWFRDFKLVFNALDNLEARRHVNKMCLAADIPLIESGTTGFNGQVQVIKKGVTACYDCTPKETPKSFPVCTIRSTPSQPIHCIVWGKSYLLNEMFGTSEDQSVLDHSQDQENGKSMLISSEGNPTRTNRFIAHEIEELKKESDALKKIRNAVGAPDFPKLLFEKVFDADIERLRSVEDMWKSKRAPEPLKYEKLLAKTNELEGSKDSILADGQKVWSLEENLVVFKDSLERLSKRIIELKKTKDDAAPDPVIVFDKDDDDTLDFVASSANIRSTIFGIERKSRFDIKQMAGNIIPAIATTNAIVAGLCVLQSYKVLKGDYSQAKEVFLTPFGSARLMAPDRAREPNTDCPVCGVFNATVTVDPAQTTLNDIVEGLLRTHLGFGEKEFVLNNEVGVLYDPDETENLPKKLIDLGIKDGSFLTVVDEDDEQPWVNVVLNIEEGALPENEKFKSSTSAQPAIPQKPKKVPQVEANGHSAGESNGIVEIDSQPKGVKRQHTEDGGQPLKKAKTGGASSDDVVIVEDAGGAIIIGDD